MISFRRSSRSPSLFGGGALCVLWPGDFQGAADIPMWLWLCDIGERMMGAPPIAGADCAGCCCNIPSDGADTACGIAPRPPCGSVLSTGPNQFASGCVAGPPQLGDAERAEIFCIPWEGAPICCWGAADEKNSDGTKSWSSVCIAPGPIPGWLCACTVTMLWNNYSPAVHVYSQ